jgi:hypothetical protein
MATERIFNIFVYFDDGVAIEYGIRDHHVDCGEGEKTAYLLSCIAQDYPLAHRFRLARKFTPEEWFAALRQGDVLHYFEEAFTYFAAPPPPVFCITSIVDGVPRVDRQIGPQPFRGDAVSKIEGYGSVPDYLVNYTDGNMFRLQT